MQCYVPCFNNLANKAQTEGDISRAASEEVQSKAAHSIVEMSILRGLLAMRIYWGHAALFANDSCEKVSTSPGNMCPNLPNQAKYPWPRIVISERHHCNNEEGKMHRRGRLISEIRGALIWFRTARGALVT